MLTKLVIELYREECNCGLKIRHNNGGNYHAVRKVHIIYDDHGLYVKILEETTTREDFPGDRYEVLTFTGGEFQLEDEERAEKIVKLEDYQVVRFRKGEAKIVEQYPKVFLEARKTRAEELAATAKALGHEASWEDFLLDV